MSEKIYEKRIKFKEWHYSKRTEEGNSAFSKCAEKKKKSQKDSGKDTVTKEKESW